MAVPVEVDSGVEVRGIDIRPPPARTAFRIGGAAPGEYGIFAWQDVEPDVWQDPEFMKPLESRAVPVTLAPGGREAVQVKAIPPE